MQKVTATLARIEAIKATQSQPHAKSDGQLTKLGLNANGGVMIAAVTPPSSPMIAQKTHNSGTARAGGRKRFQPDGLASHVEGEERPSESATISPFRSSLDGLELPQNDAGTLATVEQQNKLEEEYLQQRNSACGIAGLEAQTTPNGSHQGSPNPNQATLELQPPSPPPSLTGSPRSLPYSPYSPGKLYAVIS